MSAGSGACLPVEERIQAGVAGVGHLPVTLPGGSADQDGRHAPAGRHMSVLSTVPSRTGCILWAPTQPGTSHRGRVKASTSAAGRSSAQTHHPERGRDVSSGATATSLRGDGRLAGFKTRMTATATMGPATRPRRAWPGRSRASAAAARTGGSAAHTARPHQGINQRVPSGEDHPPRVIAGDFRTRQIPRKPS